MIVTIAALTAALTVAVHMPPRVADAPVVIFVCEHGAAKSLVAAAYFNKLAGERGLSARATFRGVSPSDALSTAALEGLRADGVAIPDGKPAAIAAEDVTGATHLFAIGCVLPQHAATSGKATTWTDIPDGQGYGPMRDAIVRHVRTLLDDMPRRQP